ncbi:MULTISPECIES: hypothetical protein [Cyanophyceae]|uniref:hypothetical protein n=1 Tax=Cyanophyceae TaxID=3028117 RepID=UPI0002A6745C|nr:MULTISPECIES: hypothetical protein [Cyanophyceae]AFZ33557.1 hypothetical protein Glo7428_5176 [Gloeocapsa sp. PCC 7428]PPS42062.1 hypothetical protein B1A85_16505 [Chroococcidiopsis sp. TS-821]
MPLPHPDQLPKIISAQVARQPGFQLGSNDWIDLDDEPILTSSVNPNNSRLYDRYNKRAIALQNEPADELLNQPDGIELV